MAFSAVVLSLLAWSGARAQDDVPSEPQGPVLQLWHELVFHERLGRLVLLNGGPESGRPTTAALELWSWDGAVWERLASDGPRWRNQACVTYDTKRGVLVLYGGVQEGKVSGDTWEWDGTSWRELACAGPGPREAAGLTFDAARGVCVLFGGAEGAGVAQDDTWSFDGTSWTKLAVRGPSARYPAGLCYDPEREVVWLFGGHTIDRRGFKTHGDTWLFDGATWERLEIAGPSPRDGARLLFEPRSRLLWLFGGAEFDSGVRLLDDLWTFDGERWTRRAEKGPSERVHAAFAHDPRRARIVLMGGSSAPSRVLTDLWEHDGESWRLVREAH